jgi:hypothetical protein
MEPVFALFEAWWWVGPATVGLGGVSYATLTSGRRRTRRLEVDAARREVTSAQAAIGMARADARAAHARMLAARAETGTWLPGFLSAPEAYRELQLAKRAQRSAVTTLRAKRMAVSAARARMAAASRDPSAAPLAALMRRHDNVTARWLDYETDVAKLIAYPQMTDARHPSTAAFLVRRAEASHLRPASATARITAIDFVAYRDAVQALEAAFSVAEYDARRSVPRG